MNSDPPTSTDPTSTDRPMPTRTPGSRQAPRGAAFIMLVLVLLIVVMASTQVFVRSVVTDRRSERSQWTLRQLQTALDSTSQVLENGRLTSVVLPVNEQTAERIKVTLEGKMITARWMHGDTEGESLTRIRP